VPGNSAARFENSVSHVEVANHLTLVPNPAFSLEAWVRADAPPASGQFWSLYRFHARGVDLQVDAAGRAGGVVYLSEQEGSGYAPFTVTSSVSVIDGEWHHLVFTREGPILSIYVDGLLAGETAVSEPVDDVNRDGFLGGSLTTKDGAHEFTEEVSPGGA
jgi:hypothetical protein